MNTEHLDQEDTKAPSKEEVITVFQEQIEVKKVQLELQELNAALAVARAEELKALSFIAQLTQQPKGESIDDEDEPQERPRTLKKEK